MRAWGGGGVGGIMSLSCCDRGYGCGYGCDVGENHDHGPGRGLGHDRGHDQGPPQRQQAYRCSSPASHCPRLRSQRGRTELGNSRPVVAFLASAASGGPGDRTSDCHTDDSSTAAAPAPAGDNSTGMIRPGRRQREEREEREEEEAAAEVQAQWSRKARCPW